MPMPYELRSPEDIAKEYGGNKQKIGAAVQAGLLDPTAGVLAGMFIDRMRSAAVEEQAPASTVAQDTLSPRPAPAPGAGAVPAGLAAMQSPQAAPMQPTPAPGAGAVQMARGGLASLNVPDTMYDYAGGGIVAFAEGDEVESLRLLPVDTLADAYVFLQERGAEIPEDMSEQAIINYANRVREMENMEVRDAGVRVSPEAASGRVQTGFPALFRDYGSGGRGDVMPETRLDATPQMPMEGGEFAPGFSPVAPTQEGLPGLMAPEGPAPERAVPFLGQMMENIVPSAQAAEPFSDETLADKLGYFLKTQQIGAENIADRLTADKPLVGLGSMALPVVGNMVENMSAAVQPSEPAPPAQQGMTPEQARAELAEIAPDWYDAGGRSDVQVIRDLEGFKERAARKSTKLGLDADFMNKIREANAMPPVGATAPVVPSRDYIGSFPDRDVMGEAADVALIDQLPTRRAAAPTPTTGLGAITPQASVDRAAKEAGVGFSDRDKALALAEFGARMMAGTSPYALQNIGTAGVGTLQSMREMEKTRAAANLEKAKLAKEKDTDFRRQLEILTDRRMRENPDLTKGEAEAMAYDDYVAAETSIQAGKLEAQRSRYAQQGRIDVAKELRAWEAGLSLSDPTTYAKMVKDPEFAAQKRAEKRAELEGRAAPAPTMAAAPGAGKTPPSAAVAELKSNPSELRRKQFDQVYGAGAAARVLGG